IGNVTLSTWNDVNMSVHHGLPGCRAVVHADVESIGFQLAHQLATGQRHESPKRRLLFFRKIEKTGDVPLRNDERVALGDREGVGKYGCELVLQADTRRLQVTERATGLVHENDSTTPNPGRIIQVADVRNAEHAGREAFQSGYRITATK